MIKIMKDLKNSKSWNCSVTLYIIDYFFGVTVNRGQ